jgi:hypothetical protein
MHAVDDSTAYFAINYERKLFMKLTTDPLSSDQPIKLLAGELSSEDQGPML